MFGNVWKHEKVCKSKPKPSPLPAPAIAIVRGEFQRQFNEYLVSQVAAGTARQWKNKAQTIFNYWEANIDQFDLDKLLEPSHHNVVFPSLKGYIDNSTVLGDKTVAKRFTSTWWSSRSRNLRKEKCV